MRIKKKTATTKWLRAEIRTCPLCGQTTRVVIPVSVYDKIYRGMSVQDAWPEGSTTERETLTSGLCRDCQEGVFSNELQTKE